MTLFIQLVDGQPVGHAVTMDNIRLLFPDTSFSWPFVPEDFEPLGFGIYDFSNQPELGTFEKAVEIAPVKDEYGRWIQAWAVEPMTDEERQNRIQQEWANVRGYRFMLMMQSDWTQIPNNPLSDEKRAEWAVYRQALRDITNQTDPFNIDWPTRPS